MSRSRRYLTSAAATVTALALLTGCGGSAVQDPYAQGAGTVADVPAGVDGASGVTAPPPSAVAGSSQDQPGSVPAGTAATANPGTTGTSDAPGGNPAAPKGEGAAQTATGPATVEQLVATAPIFGGKAACKPATLSEINLGNVSTLSGVLGELFGPVTPALNTFVTSQNACGGLNGHKIRFFQSDDQGDPSTAITKVQEMVQKNKVLAFVGNIQVLTLDAIIPTINRFKIPVIGGDSTSNSWFLNPLLFPQGAPVQSVAYGYMEAATKYFKVKRLGNIWCIEVPRQCEGIDRAMKELAPQFGLVVAKSIQASITAPSYVQQCLEFKNAGVEALGLNVDAASMVRIARSCTQVGFNPKVMAYPLAVGNEKQFLGNSWLGDAYVPMNVFPWMANSTPAEKYYQASVKKYNPGFDSGGAASLGWSAGALLVAASVNLSPTSPSTQQFLDALYQFKGQEFTTLGGLTTPRTFNKGGLPKVPYCLFAAISNPQNTGWSTVISKPTCTDVLAPSDPQANR